jgi:Barstar (barnase inhibitor)
MQLVRIDTRRIRDAASFHDVFAEAFGFPRWYGRNMDAWIDLMTYLNDPKDFTSEFRIEPGQVVTLHLAHVDDFISRCPDLYAAIVECSSFVNWRLAEQNLPPVIALSFRKSK